MRASIVAAAALAAMASVSVAHAQADGLAGDWQAAAGNSIYNLQVQPTGAYSEQQRQGMAWTHRSGVIRSSDPGHITFVVEDWEPKTVSIYHAGPTLSGGRYSQDPLPRPADETWRLTFNGPNIFTIQNVDDGETVTFTRAR
jgi:hypothetical protein